MAQLLSGPVTAPGLYAMPAADYHADPCPAPSLSHSVARLIEKRSPRHAWRAHPKLGGATRTGNRVMAIGSAAHAFLLGKDADLLVKIDAPDYKTKAAQQSRDEAYAAGHVPVLTKDWEQSETLGIVARHALETWLGAKVADCHAEASIIALEGKHWRRSRLDLVTPDLRVIVEYKTTDDASVEACERKVRSMGYDTQDAFYRHNLDLIDPAGKGQRRYVFLFQERDCPEAITLHMLDDAMLEIAEGEMRRARTRWDLCLDLNNWPAYDPGPHLIAPRPWEMSAEIEAEAEEAAA